MVGFYGGIAVVTLTLVVYPFIYIKDVSSADAYRAAPPCAQGVQASECRSLLTAEVSNVRTFNDQPEFDLQINGSTVTVNRDSGSYQPRNGDSVDVEFWRGQAMRVFGPEGTQLITNQNPQPRLQTDSAVLGIFIVGGLLSLVGAVLIGWFGRRILFARFQGMSAPTILKGSLLALALLVVIVPLTLVGQASGWLPSGRAGGTVVGVIVLLVGLAGVFVYRLLRNRSSAL
jgi:hypothetical protein